MLKVSKYDNRIPSFKKNDIIEFYVVLFYFRILGSSVRLKRFIRGGMVFKKQSDEFSLFGCLSKEGESSSHSLSNKTTIKSNQPPIAVSFDAVTILFADLAGFTRWSSGRPPVEVFDFLETLYADFDASARELGVFKVETIGDW